MANCLYAVQDQGSDRLDSVWLTKSQAETRIRMLGSGWKLHQFDEYKSGDEVAMFPAGMFILPEGAAYTKSPDAMAFEEDYVTGGTIEYIADGSGKLIPWRAFVPMATIKKMEQAIVDAVNGDKSTGDLSRMAKRYIESLPADDPLLQHSPEVQEIIDKLAVEGVDIQTGPDCGSVIDARAAYRRRRRCRS